MPPFSLHFVRITALVMAMTSVFGQVPSAWAIKDEWALKAVNAPFNISPVKRDRPVVVAIVDDGVRITHQELADFIWRNPLEEPGSPSCLW